VVGSDSKIGIQAKNIYIDFAAALNNHHIAVRDSHAILNWSYSFWLFFVVYILLNKDVLETARKAANRL